MSAFTHTLEEVADGVFAYLHPTGGWGWSNAGLVVGGRDSVMIDTLYDRPLTQGFLDAIEPLTAHSPIATLVNTHANGDHCYGNGLVAIPGVEVIASAASAREMDELPPSAMAGLLSVTDQLGPELGNYLERAFGAFEFLGNELSPPTSTFSGFRSIEIDGRVVELHELGPAHTQGDTVAYVPDASVLFAGDLLFIGGTPIVWAGPISNWLSACSWICELEPSVIVPGHGPLTDLDGVQAVARYLSTVEDGTAARHAAGLTRVEATADLDRSLDDTEFSVWLDRERLAINVATIWASLDPTAIPPSVPSLFGELASLASRY
ncbi:MAG: MBL fold metallo-hydrolase [Actinomycetota bacterium]